LNPLVELITSADPARRNQSLESACAQWNLDRLLEGAAALDNLRRRTDNLYERVRALMFLHALHRYHLPPRLPASPRALIPSRGFEQLLQRRFEEAIETFLNAQRAQGPCEAVSSALAVAYQRLAFQTLSDQVRRSVRSIRGNQWMFRLGHPADQPLRIRAELLRRSGDGSYPILREQTAVRMDLTHSAWSDIFFLGMDYPEGARVLNVSVDLGVRGRDREPRPPVSAWLRVIDEPVLRLTSVDLGTTADVTALADVFDFARDYLGLLKAAVIASGIVPPGVEGSGQSLEDLLARLVGEGRGLELVSSVNDIPKGSRLAVSTNLLGSLLSVCMRATGQAVSLTGTLEESERRLVLARAILGEWLGGSGGGWQDSGGVWPGMKLIEGVPAGEGDPEFGLSRGRLMPRHQILSREQCSAETRARLESSLVLVHGGMAQNVGPILEMVTEKYLLRSGPEWRARGEAIGVLSEVLEALRGGDVRALGAATTRNFRGPLCTIIPWATNAYTERLIESSQAAFGEDFWGFCMLGGMSGGGMGFLFCPRRAPEARDRLPEIMAAAKREFRHGLPFAMEPVVYDFSVNESGTSAGLLEGDFALMPPGYYALTVPTLLRRDRQSLGQARRTELDKFGTAARSRPELRGMVQTLFNALLPRPAHETDDGGSLPALLAEHGFDRTHHEQIRADLRAGRIGLAQNRLRADSVVEDVLPEDVADATSCDFGSGGVVRTAIGEESLRRGELAVLTLSAGAGSRWTQGAGVCKALHPFCRIAGRHRTFLEAHLAKTRRTTRQYGQPLPHIFSTSYLTHAPIEEWLANQPGGPASGSVLLSPGRAVGLRLVPTERDLRFAWQEMSQQRLDEQQQKMRDSLRAALIQWATTTGEASDYMDNLPLQCLHPVGHWYEVPNLLRNGVLAGLLARQPSLKYLLLHNVDTLGAFADPALLGHHIHAGATLTFEVISRRIDDRGGGLARVNGRVRLVEGLALPREEEEFQLSCYNTMTTWISIDPLLGHFGLSRADLTDEVRVSGAIRSMAARMPTYVTLKEVKKRWGHGQEDVFPVLQFEKLWGDMSALPEVVTRFVRVSRMRGQQLKDPAQLDGWLRDGSAGHLESLGIW
jgi:hypothetical protein